MRMAAQRPAREQRLDLPEPIRGKGARRRLSRARVGSDPVDASAKGGHGKDPRGPDRPAGVRRGREAVERDVAAAGGPECGVAEARRVGRGGDTVDGDVERVGRQGADVGGTGGGMVVEAVSRAATAGEAEVVGRADGDWAEAGSARGGGCVRAGYQKGGGGNLLTVGGVG